MLLLNIGNSIYEIFKLLWYWLFVYAMLNLWNNLLQCALRGRLLCLISPHRLKQLFFIPVNCTRFIFILNIFPYVSFFQWHINFHVLFNAKAILIDKQQWDGVAKSWRNKGVLIFRKGIAQKGNVAPRLKFELAYFKL